MDHDQRFKTLIKTFFEEFLSLFFEEVAQALNFSHIEWLTQELFLFPPDGESRYLDVLGKLTTKQPLLRPGTRDQYSRESLVHVEIESSDAVALFPPRMTEYRCQIRANHPGMPVFSVALYLGVGLNGNDWHSYEEYYQNHLQLQVRFPYVGLPALNAEEFLVQENWLGVALITLMRMPAERRFELTVEAWRRLVRCPEDQERKRLLLDCLVAYYSTDESQRTEFVREAFAALDPEEQNMSSVLHDFFENKGRQEGLQKGLEQGREQGLEQGREAHAKTILTKLIEEQFGSVPQNIQEALSKASLHEIDTWILKVPRAQSIEDIGLPMNGQQPQ